MRSAIAYFNQDEDGAVTVDWVVLTAAIVGMAAGTIAMVNQATTEPASAVGNYVGERTDLLETN